MAVELDTDGNGAIDIEKGGTNATSAVQALSNLGGQPFDADLTTLSSGTYAQKRALIEAFAKPVLGVDALRTTMADFDGDCRYLAYHTASGDGGHGVFRWDASSTASDDNGVTIAVTGVATGRWVRQYDGPLLNVFYGPGEDGIRAMLNSAGSRSDMKIVSGGYTISSPIAVTLPGYNTIHAEGAVFTCTHDGLVFDFNVTKVAQTPMFRWYGGRFVNTNASKTASIAMYFEEWRNVAVFDCRFESFYQAVVSVDRDTYTFQNCHFFGNKYAINFDNTLSSGSWGNLTIKAIDCHFSLANCVAGIFADGVIGELVVDGCSFNGTSATGTDIHVKNTGNVSGMRCATITNNHFEQGVAGQRYLHFEDTATGAPYRGVNIRGNAFNDNGPDAVTLESVWGADIAGNSFAQSTSSPINIDANCLDISVGANGFSIATITFACPRSEISVFPYLKSVAHTPVTGYNGNSFSTGSATIDMSSAIASIFPTRITPKGYSVVVQARDSASAASPTLRVDVYGSSGAASQNRIMARVGGIGNDILVGASGFVPCDANGDIYINYVASGAGTLDIYLAITAIHF